MIDGFVLIMVHEHLKRSLDKVENVCVKLIKFPLLVAFFANLVSNFWGNIIY